MANKKAKIRFEEEIPSSYLTSSVLLENQGILDLKFPTLIGDENPYFVKLTFWFLSMCDFTEFYESFHIKKKKTLIHWLSSILTKSAGK